MYIEKGEIVNIVLQNPREKFWGVLGDISAAGVFARGLDLNAFEDFIRALSAEESFFGLTDTFFPMWRVERLTRDESSQVVPSLAEQFFVRTGRDIREF